METLGWLNSYEVHYLPFVPGTQWAEALPSRNWVLFVTVGGPDRVGFDELTKECLQHHPLGIGCAGPSAALLEDWFDEEIVMRAVRWEEQHQQPFDYGQAPVTVSDADIAAGFWFTTLNSPNLCAEAVERVVCVDVTGTHHDQLVELLQLIKAGWLLPDEPEHD
ncbi:hypothetical protein GCM10027048_39770 [Hymenobacter coalescens]